MNQERPNPVQQTPHSALAIVRDRSFLWVLALGLMAGLVVPLTHALAGMQNGDGILTALISTQKLTWYFWGQDRLLNVIPALATFVSNVEWNLRLQIFLRAFFAFLAPAGILFFLNQSARFHIVAITLANCLLALTLGPDAVFNLYVENNPFGTSLVLFALSLGALHQGDNKIRWLLISTLLGFIAYATNFALLAFSFPLIALAICAKLLPRRQLFLFLIINAICIILAHLHSKHYGMSHTPFNKINISLLAIKAGYATVAGNIAWVSLLAVGLAALAWGRHARVAHYWTTVCLALGSIALIGILSCSFWAQQNNYVIRYYLIFLISISTCISYLITASLYKFLRDPKIYLGTLTGLFVIEITIGLHGFSSKYAEFVAEPWRADSQAIADVVVANKVQLVVGGFWDVWPAVFDSLAESGSNHDHEIYGAAFRGEVLRRRIQRLVLHEHGIRALCLKDTIEACTSAAMDGLQTPMTVVPDSVKGVTIAGKPMLLMTMTFTSS